MPLPRLPKPTTSSGSSASSTYGSHSTRGTQSTGRGSEPLSLVVVLSERSRSPAATRISRRRSLTKGASSMVTVKTSCADAYRASSRSLKYFSITAAHPFLPSLHWLVEMA